jgi:hypothetical protein
MLLTTLPSIYLFTVLAHLISAVFLPPGVHIFHLFPEICITTRKPTAYPYSAAAATTAANANNTSHKSKAPSTLVLSPHSFPRGCGQSAQFSSIGSRPLSGGYCT